MLHQEERDLEQLARHRDLEAKFTELQRRFVRNMSIASGLVS